MLFPSVEDLTRTWRLVVDGVINNRLGPTAKVAPDQGKPGERLICIYTKDFRDENDVLRVLRELVSIGVSDITVMLGAEVNTKSGAGGWPGQKANLLQVGCVYLLGHLQNNGG